MLIIDESRTILMVRRSRIAEGLSGLMLFLAWSLPFHLHSRLKILELAALSLPRLLVMRHF